MTHADIYTKFMIEYDKANITSSYPSLTPYEVATILDKAYLALIARKITGNNPRQSTFESDIKSIEDLRPLIVNKVLSSTTSTVYADNESVYTLPTDVLYYIEGQVQYNKNTSSIDAKSHKNELVNLVSHELAQRFKATNSNLPWIKQPVSFIEGNDIHLLIDSYKHKNDTKSFLVTYLKKPAKFANPTTPSFPGTTDNTGGNTGSEVETYAINGTITSTLDTVCNINITYTTTVAKHYKVVALKSYSLNGTYEQEFSYGKTTATNSEDTNTQRESEDKYMKFQLVDQTTDTVCATSSVIIIPKLATPAPAEISFTMTFASGYPTASFGYDNKISVQIKTDITSTADTNNSYYWQAFVYNASGTDRYGFSGAHDLQYNKNGWSESIEIKLESSFTALQYLVQVKIIRKSDLTVVKSIEKVISTTSLPTPTLSIGYLYINDNATVNITATGDHIYKNYNVAFVKFYNPNYTDTPQLCSGGIQSMAPKDEVKRIPVVRETDRPYYVKARLLEYGTSDIKKYIVESDSAAMIQKKDSSSAPELQYDSTLGNFKLGESTLG